MKRKKTPTPDLEELIPILIGIWRRYRKEPGPPDHLQTREFRSVVEAIQRLQNPQGQDLFAQPELLGAYLLYQWVIHYQQGLSLINEVPLTPMRVLDVCSGPAPFAFAALRHGAHEVYAVDQNLAALQLGAEVCGRYGLPLAIRRWNCLKAPLPIEGQFDLIILGHCLSELFPDTEGEGMAAQQRFITDLLNRLTPRGFLLMVEDSFPDANRRVLRLRDRLVKAGIPVQAPCVWKGECPALQTGGAPCYAQRELEKPHLIKEFQRAAGINLSSLKMSYLLLRSPQAVWPELPPKRLYRIISPPVTSFHGTRYYLCGADGKKNLGARLEPLPKEAKAFDYLRRGELIAIEEPLEHHNALDIVEGTSLIVEAACGKPLPQREEEEES
jgi:Mitochondrial small ribosomal subunit Rsm22